jgi:hypothetical protein
MCPDIDIDTDEIVIGAQLHVLPALPPHIETDR